jgi:glycosyltransferase involved in cell wall biosynthesis
MKKKISILIPIFNEKENINIIYNKIINTISCITERYDYEILFLDNHSNDGSYEICKTITQNNKNTRVIRHSRNFGYQSNILSGYDNCVGDSAITIDSDGQDDPKYILDFINMWERGYDVVYGIRKTRTDNFFIKIFIYLFYKILNYFSEISIPVNAGDFRLIDKKIIIHLKKFREKNIFLRGVIFYLGFNQIGLEYSREDRLKGSSKFSLLQYFDFGQNGILSFSKLPLKFIALFGFVIFFFSIILIFIYLYKYFNTEISQPGFMTIIIISLFFFGIIIFFLGIMSLYVGQIVDEVKDRPRYIIDDKED